MSEIRLDYCPNCCTGCQMAWMDNCETYLRAMEKNKREEQRLDHKGRKICCGTVGTGYWKGNRCGAFAKYQSGSLWYCKNHLPISSTPSAGE